METGKCDFHELFDLSDCKLTIWQLKDIVYISNNLLESLLLNSLKITFLLNYLGQLITINLKWLPFWRVHIFKIEWLTQKTPGVSFSAWILYKRGSYSFYKYKMTHMVLPNLHIFNMATGSLPSSCPISAGFDIWTPSKDVYLSKFLQASNDFIVEVFFGDNQYFRIWQNWWRHLGGHIGFLKDLANQSQNLENAPPSGGSKVRKEVGVV